MQSIHSVVPDPGRKCVWAAWGALRAALIAAGITAEGRRTILRVDVSLSEAEVYWRDFLASLQARGLHGVKMIVSDDRAGLRAALTAPL